MSACVYSFNFLTLMRLFLLQLVGNLRQPLFEPGLMLAQFDRSSEIESWNVIWRRSNSHVDITKVKRKRLLHEYGRQLLHQFSQLRICAWRAVC